MSTERYNPKKIQARWQKKWSTDKIFVVDLQKSARPFLAQGSQDFGVKPKFYNLMMFPYPSGDGLHVGHVYAFGGADTYGHFKKMQGFDVFEPMGFDSFGIHSENYALKIKKHPQQLIDETTKYFREEQLQKLGALFDWDHEVITSDIHYYRWTQWLFVQLFKAGLAVRKKAAVDWCPSCKTVLADEQVIAGNCERCGTEVIQKELEQWFFKITVYAQKLLDNLETIDWSETTKTMQRNWIGRSEGAEIEFRVKNSELQHALGSAAFADAKVSESFADAKVKVYTTRPDTIFGATFMVIAPEHPQIDQLITKDNTTKVSDYINQARNKSEVERAAEKSGVFTGSYAINPLTKNEVPIWVADYVLMGYGTGAVMAVPAHDQRDFEFAKKYDLEIKAVISSESASERSLTGVRDDKEDNLKEAFVGEGKLVNSGEFNGLTSEEAKEKISEYIESKNIGSRKVNFHLRDWLISRQRYWGPPIPMIHCENCAKQGKSWFTTEEAEKRLKDQSSQMKEKNTSQDLKSEMPGWPARHASESVAGWYPVAEEDLPVKLPEVEDYQPKGSGVSPLAALEDFVNVKCPACGSNAKRETDVSDTFLDSSWYFLRYPSVGIKNSEHALGSAAFANAKVSESFANAKVELPWNQEITKKWLPVDSYIGGNEHAVLHLLYSRFITMALHDMGLIDFEEPFKKFRAHGLIIYKGAKMSKSRGNVVNPNEYIDAYGSDALKMYLLFIGPFELGGEFNDRAITGVYRFLNRVWTLVQEGKFVTNTDPVLANELNKLNSKVESDLENLKFNTAIAALMEFLNELYKNRSSLSREIVVNYLLLLAPLAPFTTEELWEILGETSSIHLQKWPDQLNTTVKEEQDTIIIQVNGRFRDKIEVDKDVSKEEVSRLALDQPKVKTYTQNKQPKNIIYVAGKLINIVI